MSSSVAFSVFNQIRILVTNLSKKNFKSSVSELKDLIRSHGDEAKFFLLKSLIEEIEYQDKSSKSWDHFKMLLLGQEITELSSRPNFSSVICRSLEARLRLLPRYYPLIDPLLSILESQSLPSHFLVPFMRPLKLPLTQQLLIALGLAKSTDAKAAEEGAAFLRGKLLLLLENHPADLASGEGSKKNEFVDEKLPDSTLHELVFWIRTSSSSMASSLSSNQRTAVVAALAALYREQFAAPELAPLASLSNSGQMVDSSESLKSLPPPNSQLFDMIHARDTVSRSSAASASGNNNNSTQAYVRPCDVVYELGYGCMDRSSTLTSALAAFKGISEHDVACIIAVLCRTCSYLHPMDESRVALQSVLLTTSGKDIPDNSAVKDKDGNGWKADVFVHAMKELNPKLNWTEVMLRLDNNEFFVQDERSFRCLMNICKYANVTGVPSGPSQYRFPVEILYTPWRNQEGQLSLIKQVLLAQIPISPSSSSSGSSSSSSGSSSSSSSLPLNSGCIDIVSLLNAPSGRVQRSIDGLNWAPNVAAAMNKSASKGGAAGNPVRQHQQMFHCWYSVDFVENLLDMGERATMARVRDYKTSSSSGAGASATAPGENAEGKDDLTSGGSNGEHLSMSHGTSSSLLVHLNALFQHALNNCPELLLTGLAHVAEKKTLLSQYSALPPSSTSLVISSLVNLPAVGQSMFAGKSGTHSAFHADNPTNAYTYPFTSEILDLLIPLFMISLPLPPNAGPVMQRIWQISPRLMIKWMIRVYYVDRSYLSRILDIAQDLKDSLTVILDASAFAFTIDLACLASKRELLHLERWVNLRIAEHGPRFVVACVEYIRENGLTPPPSAKDGATSGPEKTKFNPLSVEGMAVFFKCIFQANNNKVAAAAQQPNAKKDGNGNSASSSNVPNAGTAPPVLTPEQLAEVGRLHQQCAGVHARLQSLTGYNNIEDEANLYFDKIYKQKMSPVEVVEMLLRFKNAPPESKRERDIFVCMIHNLFDEYRFYSQYPPRELHITGVLFGLLIQHQVVTDRSLNVALFYVLEALRKDDSSNENKKLQKFGLWALAEFKNRLIQWPHYCMQIITIPHLRQSEPIMISFLENVVAQAQQQGNHGDQSKLGLGLGDKNDRFSMDGPNFTGGKDAAEQPSMMNIGIPGVDISINNPSAPIRTASSSQLSVLNVDTLVAAEKMATQIVMPSDQVAERIHFIINNVTKSNIPQQCKLLMNVLTPELYPFFSRYFVVKRVSTELNFQNLYAQFCDALNVREINNCILETTYDNIKVLISGDKILQSSSERTLLKNLGSWLGYITIARNRPIRANKLMLKELILDAFERGRLMAIIPFTATILKAAAQSKVFRPTNPWMMALLGILHEIFELPALKLNLKFEIEVLFQSLNIDNKTIKPTNTLKERRYAQMRAAQAGPHHHHQQQQQQQQFPGGPGLTLQQQLLLAQQQQQQQDKGLVGPPVLGRGQAGNSALMLQQQQQQQQQGGVLNNALNYPGGQNSGQFPPEQSVIPPNMYITIHPSVTLFAQFPHLKRCVPTAIDRAIRATMSPVVERSVTIAFVTTRELVLKDFAMEPDESKLRHASHQMVQNLAASLALVTCRELLRVSMNDHLSSLFEANLTNPGAAERQLIALACEQISGDNLDLGCMLIEKAASERSVREIDDALTPHIQIRKKHREQTGQNYYDMSIFSNNEMFPSAMPDSLRPKPNPTGLHPMHLKVYDDFARMRTAPQILMAAAQAEQQANGGVSSEGNKSVDNTSTTQQAQGLTATGAAAGASSQHQQHQHQQQLLQQQQQQHLLQQQQPIPQLTSQQTLDKLVAMFVRLEELIPRITTFKSVALAMLPGDSDIKGILTLLPPILNQCPNEVTYPRDVVGYTFAHKVFKRLFDRELRGSMLHIDVFVYILKCIRSICPKVVKELFGWLFYSETEHDRKYMLESVVALLRARLLQLPEVDAYFAKSVIAINQQNQVTTNNRVHPHLEYVLGLVRRVCCKDPCVNIAEFPYLVDALRRLAREQERRNKSISDIVLRIIEESRAQSAHIAMTPDSLTSGIAGGPSAVPLPGQVQGGPQGNQLTGGPNAQGGVSGPLAAAQGLSGPSSQGSMPPSPQIGSVGAQTQSSPVGLGVGVGVGVGGVGVGASLDSNAGAANKPSAGPGVGGGGQGAPTSSGAAAAAASSFPGPGFSVTLEQRETMIEELDTLLDSTEFDEQGNPVELGVGGVPPPNAEVPESGNPNEGILSRKDIIQLLEEWLAICLQGAHSDQTYVQYLMALQRHRVLATSRSTQHFFRTIVQLCVDTWTRQNTLALSKQQQQGQQGLEPADIINSFTTLDALSKLVVFLVKYHELPAREKERLEQEKKIQAEKAALAAAAVAAASGGAALPADLANDAAAGAHRAITATAKVRLLNEFLVASAWVLRMDFDKRETLFNRRPYFRLYNNLLQDLNAPDAMLDSNEPEVLLAFVTCFRLTRPSRVPPFVFSWLEFISHRMFLPKLLLGKNAVCSASFCKLVVELIAFMQPYLRNAELTDSIRLLYKGTLRLLLVLLHDFPEFLYEYHFALCDVIPSTCIQMRNLILSAIPRSMRLPDPFTQNLKVDLLPEIQVPPRIGTDIALSLKRNRLGLMDPLDSYIRTRAPTSFLKQMLPQLTLQATGAANGWSEAAIAAGIKRAGTVYDVPMVNSLVLYVSMQAITKLQSQNKSGMVTHLYDNPCMDVIEAMITNLDPEGRYYVLNAIVNQLRFPNNHTHYFSCVVLYLFLQIKVEMVREQITRVLLERLIVHRPHPWGLLITFIELIKNPRYEFKKEVFASCSPEIQKLLDSVAKSCVSVQRGGGQGGPAGPQGHEQ